VLDVVPHLEALAVILLPFHAHSSSKVFRLYAEFSTSTNEPGTKVAGNLRKNGLDHEAWGARLPEERTGFTELSRLGGALGITSFRKRRGVK
jgi:hypothetical protein